MAANPFSALSSNVAWHLLVDAAKRALAEDGYAIHRVPGRGLSNVWLFTHGGKRGSAAIRTSRNRWFAFPPLDGGMRWKTLDDVDEVIVAAVDHPRNPLQVEVYRLDAKLVRGRFKAAHAARIAAGQRVKDDYGMWVNLDQNERGTPASVGSGLAQEFPPIASYRVAELLLTSPEAALGAAAAEAPMTIANVVAAARQRVAQIAGVSPDAVKVDVRIEY